MSTISSHGGAPDDETLAAPSASVGPALGGQSSRWLRVSLSPDALLAPESCACCQELASTSLALEGGRDGAGLLIGYCVECARHAGRDGTRTLGVALASSLLAVTLAAAWPLFRVEGSLALHLAVVAAASGLPLLIGALLRPGAAPGHAAWGRAVGFSGRQLLCASAGYVAELRRKNPGLKTLGHTRAPWFSAWMLSGPLLGASLVLFTHDIYQPTLRVLNLSGERFDLYVDGRHQGSVPPSSVESPSAGIELRVVAGAHRLEARGPGGRMISRDDVSLASGVPHLYAPASTEYCFWLETVAYGRVALAPERALLEGELRFWKLPEQLDGWFVPPVPGTRADGALSGGYVTVLRQAPCAQAPFPQ